MTMLVIKLSPGWQQDRDRLETALGGPEKVACRVDLWGGTLLLARVEPDAGLERELSRLPGVAEVFRPGTPYLLSARRTAPGRTRVPVRPELAVGGEEFVVMAGPCAVESALQVMAAAGPVAAAGARVLRGGAYKPRTSPFAFQGRGEEGLEILRQAGRETGLATVSEVLDLSCLDRVAERTDIVQVGMRNALNYPLLRALGRHPDRPPVLLKRGAGSTIDEFLCAADYILSGGNPNLILCLRGTVNFSNFSRGSLNIADIPTLRRLTHLPVLVDPSHAAGRRELVPAMAAAALAAGADGLLVEVHHNPEEALSDGPQSITPGQFERLMRRLRRLAPIMGRTMAPLAGTEPAAAGHPLEDLDLEPPPEEPEEWEQADDGGNL